MAGQIWTVCQGSFQIKETGDEEVEVQRGVKGRVVLEALRGDETVCLIAARHVMAEMINEGPT